MPASRQTYRPRHRLTHARQFRAVYAARTSRTAGPFVVFGLPSDLGHPRLGLSVGARVGTAVRRNRVKRLLREAFRALQHDLPPLDLVVNVRPHGSAGLSEYTAWLGEAARGLLPEWERRRAKEQRRAEGDTR